MKFWAPAGSCSGTSINALKKKIEREQMTVFIYGWVYGYLENRDVVIGLKCVRRLSDC